MDRKETYFERKLGEHPGILGRFAEIVTNIPTVRVEGIINLDKARRWLNYGSLLLYFAPHTSIWDPALVTQHVIKPYFNPRDSNQFAWLTSVKFTGDIKEIADMGLARTASEVYARKMAFSILPIFQPYLLRKIQDRQIRQKVVAHAREINEKSLKRAKVMLDEPGTIVAMSLEGTRGKTGGLLRAQNGVEQLADNNQTLILPITIKGAHLIQPPTDVGLKNLNPLQKISLIAGRPISFQEAELLASNYSWKDGGNFTLTDALIVHLMQSGLQVIREGIDPAGVYSSQNLFSQNL